MIGNLIVPSAKAKTALMIFMDCLFCWLSWMFAVLVFTSVSNGSHGSIDHVAAYGFDRNLIRIINQQLWVMILACTAAFVICGMYKVLWRHPGFDCICRLVAAALLTTLVVYIFLWFTSGTSINHVNAYHTTDIHTNTRAYHATNFQITSPAIGVTAFYFFLTLSAVPRLFIPVRNKVSRYFHNRIHSRTHNRTHSRIHKHNHSHTQVNHKAGG